MKSLKSTVGLFFKGLGRSFFWMLLLFLAGFLSYKATYHYYEAKKGDTDTSDRITKALMADNNKADILRNVVYGVDEDTGKIMQVLLEVYDKKAGKLIFITIPGDVKFELSSGIYQKLCVINDDIPQIICMENLWEYFEGEKIYEYGNVILEDVTELKIDIYTKLGQEDFLSYFYEGNGGKFVIQDKNMKNWGEVLVSFKMLPGANDKAGVWQGKEKLHKMLR